jgi:hypothetical protein
MPIDQWSNFFFLCGSAAATLTGLTFIAVTMGSTLIKKENMHQVNIFVSPICFHFLHVFFLCCMTAIPGVNPKLLAGATILSAFWRLVKLPKTYSVIRTRVKENNDVDLSDWSMVVAFPTAVYLTLIASGIGFMLEKPWAIEILAISCLSLLLISTKAAWDLVIWIAASLD